MSGFGLINLKGEFSHFFILKVLQNLRHWIQETLPGKSKYYNWLSVGVTHVYAIMFR